jgi:phosphoglycolate phosphatase
MEPALLRAAIIDLDGTLVDTLGDFEVALAAMLCDLGLPPIERAFIRRTVGKGSEYLIERVLVEVGGEAARAKRDAAWASYQRHYARINGAHAPVFEGVLPGLQALRALGWPLACLTNKPGAFAKALLAAKGLAGYFDHVFGGDAYTRKKPDPLPLTETCRALGVAPRETLMVGDSSNDAAAARAAGCPVVLMSYGYNHGQSVESAAPDAVLERLDELPALLTRWGLVQPGPAANCC